MKNDCQIVFQQAASICAFLVAVAGCASVEPLPPLNAVAIELKETPFFPQTDYMCGPSALATVFQRTGIAVSPKSLERQVYVPGRQGSLQIEMIATVRQRGRLAVPVEGTLEAIIGELETDRPVLVLQNLAMRRLPIWHYAVVIGYDPRDDSFILRSGTKSRLIMGRTQFKRTWTRADSWAIVVLKPGELPQSADPSAYVDAVVGLETVGGLEAALIAYKAGLGRWPGNQFLLFGYGNALYTSGDTVAAITIYRKLLEHHPKYIPGVNNLAQALGDMGCQQDALTLIDNLGTSANGSFADALANTRAALVDISNPACTLDNAK